MHACMYAMLYMYVPMLDGSDLCIFQKNLKSKKKKNPTAVGASAFFFVEEKSKCGVVELQ